MAQVAAGFPWHSQRQTQNLVLSEKLIGNGRSELPAGSQAMDPADNGELSYAAQPSADKQKQSSKSRKRASSVKPPASIIPQTREEIDAHLSYAPSRQFNVRTVPPWVRDAIEDDVIEELDDDNILDSPHAALVAQHNSSPAKTFRSGRQERHTTSSGATRADQTSRWITFARSSAYPRENFHGEKVDVEWLNQNITDYSRPWLERNGDDPDNDGNRYRALVRKQQVWYKRAQYTILRNPFVPLAFRFTVIVFAAAAIGLGASIYQEAGVIQSCKTEPPGSRSQYCINIVGEQDVDYYRDPSGLMAVIVDAIAIFYTGYITYDEYFSKPLGLRPARAKVRLVLLDLFFIVFQSANLSLAFESLTVDQGACSVGNKPSTSYRFDKICDRAEALSAVLFVSLVAWLLTFSVSVLRLVEKLNIR